jgi:hypothetical protein
MPNLDQLLENAYEGELPTWKKLESEIISNQLPKYKNQFGELSNYGLVHVIVDEKGKPVKRKTDDGKEIFFVVTSRSLATRFEQVHNLDNILNPLNETQKLVHKLNTMMLGEFLTSLKRRKTTAIIKVNPILFQESETNQPSYLCEELIFTPIYDRYTQKLMISDPEEGKALLAIPHEDQERFGIEMVFHILTNRNLPAPDDRENRDKILRKKMEELAFTIPRVPVKRGSGSLICVILNLDNFMEESAFIRTYKTFDPYTNVIFVTSKLKIMTGELDTIPYNSDTIDQVFTPLIDWQRKDQWQQSRV